MEIPTKKEFLTGVREFENREKRDAMYKVATFLVAHFWAEPGDMADALGVLLLTWNQAFYRYGAFDFKELEQCIRRNLHTLDVLRHRDISDLTDADEDIVEGLFEEFLKALQIASGKKAGTRTPVGVAKALHLLAPCFFPVWDYKIAKAYKCSYTCEPAAKYFRFCKVMQELAQGVSKYAPDSRRSILKLVDEYNYAKYTQEWI